MSLDLNTPTTTLTVFRRASILMSVQRITIPVVKTLRVSMSQVNEVPSSCKIFKRSNSHPLGSFKCTCNPGFDGNGYQCDRLVKNRNYLPQDERTRDEQPHREEEQARYYEEQLKRRQEEIRRRQEQETRRQEQEARLQEAEQKNQDRYYETDRPDDQRSYESRHQAESTCQYCSPYATCVDGQCECKEGYHGNGRDCNYNCRSGQVWNGNACEQISQAVECKYR